MRFFYDPRGKKVVLDGLNERDLEEVLELLRAWVTKRGGFRGLSRLPAGELEAKRLEVRVSGRRRWFGES